MKIIIRNLDNPKVWQEIHTEEMPASVMHLSHDPLGIMLGVMLAAESGQLIQIGRTTYEPERSEVLR